MCKLSIIWQALSGKVLGLSAINLEPPYLSEVRVVNPPLPLWHAHWRGLVETAFLIRQKVSEPLEKGGLNFTLTQYENTARGVETLRGEVNSKKFLKEKKAGVQSWISWLCTIINERIKGFNPIERLRLVQLPSTNFLAYYGAFYSKQMEIIIYIGSREDEDGATVVHRKRSEVDITTRDWKVLGEVLPQVVWIPRGERNDRETLH